MSWRSTIIISAISWAFIMLLFNKGFNEKQITFISIILLVIVIGGGALLIAANRK